MKMGEGVEQAIHSVAMLSGLSEGGVLSAAAIAEFHGVSTSYLLKHLQSLSGAGILDTVPGPKADTGWQGRQRRSRCSTLCSPSKGQRLPSAAVKSANGGRTPSPIICFPSPATFRPPCSGPSVSTGRNWPRPRLPISACNWPKSTTDRSQQEAALSWKSTNAKRLAEP